MRKLLRTRSADQLRSALGTASKLTADRPLVVTLSVQLRATVPRDLLRGAEASLPWRPHAARPRRGPAAGRGTPPAARGGGRSAPPPPGGAGRGPAPAPPGAGAR